MGNTEQCVPLGGGGALVYKAFHEHNLGCMWAHAVDRNSEHFELYGLYMWLYGNFK